MGLINSVGQYFEKLVDGFKIGTNSFLLTIKGNLEVQSNGNTAEHTFPNRNGTVALLDDWANLRPYTSYVALLSQASTGAPIPTILENNLGTIVWTYDVVGGYIGTLAGGFPAGKTFLQVQANDGWQHAMSLVRTNANQIYLQSGNTSSNVASNDWEASIEIRVYP